MFEMSKGWERFFYLLTGVSIRASFILPRPYAMLHRAHHAYSDTERDPHSPHHTSSLWQMMWLTRTGATKRSAAAKYSLESDSTAATRSGWRSDRFFNFWPVRVAFGTAYTLFYIAFAPHWAYFLLLPIHYLMGPVHGAIVNTADTSSGTATSRLRTATSPGTRWRSTFSPGETISEQPPRASNVTELRLPMVRDLISPGRSSACSRGSRSSRLRRRHARWLRG